MNPREVNFSKFKVTDENILFEDRDFCVAISVYENEYRIGMRWNGEDKNITRLAGGLFYDVLSCLAGATIFLLR